MNSLPARFAVLALVVALCALRCNCACMSDAVGTFLGHAAAPAHTCCHECEDSTPGQPPGQPTQTHDSGCCADDRIPSQSAPEIPVAQAAPLILEFAPSDGWAISPRWALAAHGDPRRPRCCSLLRLHCALIV